VSDNSRQLSCGIGSSSKLPYEEGKRQTDSGKRYVWMEEDGRGGEGRGGDGMGWDGMD